MRRVPVVFLALLLGACASGGGHPVPVPPTPVPTPWCSLPNCSDALSLSCWTRAETGACIYTCPDGIKMLRISDCAPKPEPICAELESFKMSVRKTQTGATWRVLADGTPGHGTPSCIAGQGRPCSDPGSFVRLSPEGGSLECEQLAGPYSATLNGEPCEGQCFQNNGNPLQYVVKKSGLFKLIGGNGKFSTVEIVVP